jgi:biopolymer transport protein ExbD
MRIRHTYTSLDKVEMQMTPMIDIVFQLNIFFILTFKIVLPEGDFNIRMPSTAAHRSVDQSETFPMTITMKAGADGRLADLRLDSQSFGNGRDAFARLHQVIRNRVNDAAGPGTVTEMEVEINADYDLQYDYTVKAITAVTGYIENGEAHKLIERVKFSPPKK